MLSEVGESGYHRLYKTRDRYLANNYQGHMLVNEILVFVLFPGIVAGHIYNIQMISINWRELLSGHFG